MGERRGGEGGEVAVDSCKTPKPASLTDTPLTPRPSGIMLSVGQKAGLTRSKASLNISTHVYTEWWRRHLVTTRHASEISA